MALDFSTILGGVLTGGAGGLIGVLGNFANTWLAIKQAREQNAHQIALLQAQTTASIEIAKANIAVESERGAAAGFAASQEADRATGHESRWALNVKAMVRPTILFLLFCGVVALYLSGELATDMRAYVIQNIVTDFSMAVSWYFGARATALVMQGFKSKAGT